MQRKQKKREGEVNLESPQNGWNPFSDAKNCLRDIKNAVDICNTDDVIAHVGCAFANAEAAFYEGQVSEDEMNTIKDFATHFGSEFTNRCKCKKR